MVEWTPSEVLIVCATPLSIPTLAPVAVRSKGLGSVVKLMCHSPDLDSVMRALLDAVTSAKLCVRRNFTRPALGMVTVAHFRFKPRTR
ncbi:hypothetical protein SAMN04487913_110162 [Arthrobacter sp. ok362]|nr:hypothetical protein SAMN04487913_110162 [Arthrobacter sp. ok362]